MNFWIIAIGEPLPTDVGSPRLLRAGILTSQIAAAGMQVTWWNSNFDHSQKIVRSSASDLSNIQIPYQLRLLKGKPYPSNVSIARVCNHIQVALDFSQLAPKEPPPDLIFVAYPTVELCKAALAYARPRGIPVVVDIRDLWPDIFVNLFPQWFKPIAMKLFFGLFRASKQVCAGATAITGITDVIVDWGVNRAGRHRLAWDKAYPLAYQVQLPGVEKLASARAQWDACGLGEDVPKVCFFGSLGRQFDIPCLIKAARLLTDTPLQIVICGTGENMEEYRRSAVDLSHVHFPGWVDAPAIRALMERSLAGLAPYYNEMSFTMSLPNKTIEYLAGGLPIISTLRGELSQLLAVNECGITVPEGDHNALADALRKLLSDRGLREKMSKNASELFKARFTAEAVYRQLIDDLKLIATECRQGQRPIKRVSNTENS
jgi:glycosyltransferase involved in cell wall biosynthesis